MQVSASESPLALRVRLRGWAAFIELCRTRPMGRRFADAERRRSCGESDGGGRRERVGEPALNEAAGRGEPAMGKKRGSRVVAAAWCAAAARAPRGWRRRALARAAPIARGGPPGTSPGRRARRSDAWPADVAGGAA